MASLDDEQKLRDARVTYIAAARRLSHALGRFDHSGMAMDPGRDPDNPIRSTRDQVQIIRAAAAAFREILDARQRWDRMRRDAQNQWRSPTQR